MELRLSSEDGGQQQGSMFSLYHCMIGVVVVSVGWWLASHRYWQRHYLGPKTWPLIGCFVEQLKNFEVIHDWLLEYFHRGILTYPVPMLGWNNIFTADPQNVEHILKNNFPNYPKGELLRDRFIDLMGLGIFNVDGDQWRHQRKVVTMEFSSAKLRDFSIYSFRKEALKLVQVLAMASKRGQPVDIQDCFMRLTLDSICKVGFGVDIGCLSPELPILPFAKSFDEANKLIVRRYIDLSWKVKRYFNIGAERELKKHIEIINKFLYNVIDTRRAELQASQEQNGVDILSRFMSNTDGDTEEAYTDQRLRDIVINFIIAGRDTTALTLSWFFYELSQNPHVAEKIVEEIDRVVGTFEIPEEDFNSDGDFASSKFAQAVEEFSTRLTTYSNLSKLHYLHAALTEALRLYPAVPLETKIAAGDDTFPDGTQVKKGEFVSYASYAMGRLPNIWGEDALEFKPERFLVNNLFQPISPFKMTAFQAGPRICLGKDSAYMQMKITAAILLKVFRFWMPPNEPPPKYAVMVVLYIANGLRLGVSRQQQ